MYILSANKVFQCVSCCQHYDNITFSALTLLTGGEQGHLVYNKVVSKPFKQQPTWRLLLKQLSVYSG